MTISVYINVILFFFFLQKCILLFNVVKNNNNQCDIKNNYEKYSGLPNRKILPVEEWKEN